MRWVLWVAVVVSAASVRAEEAPVHRPSPIAFRASVLAGAGFTFGPDPVCPSCENPLASFSGGVELAVVLRSSAGEGFLANQLVWQPIFPKAYFGQLTQMLSLTTEVGFLGRVHPRVLFGPGAMVAYAFASPPGVSGTVFRADHALLPGFALHAAAFLDANEVHRVGVNLIVLVRLSAPGVIVLPTFSYSATLPW